MNNFGKIGQKGVVQLPVIIGLLIMAIAIPLAAKLTQESQDTRNRAADYECQSSSECADGYVCKNFYCVKSGEPAPKCKEGDVQRCQVNGRAGQKECVGGKWSQCIETSSEAQDVCGMLPAELKKAAAACRAEGRRWVSPCDCMDPLPTPNPANYGLPNPNLGKACMGAEGDNDEWCGPGLFCDGTTGRCEKQKTDGSDCARDENCSGGACVKGKCIKKTGLDGCGGAGITCPAGMYCDDRVNLNVETGNGVCREKVAENGVCENDSECGTGLQCNFSCCVPDSAYPWYNGTCDDQKLVEDKSENDACGGMAGGCPVGMYCDDRVAVMGLGSGVCRKEAQDGALCEDDQECTGSSNCTGNRCVPEAPIGSGDVDCKCSGGYWVGTECGEFQVGTRCSSGTSTPSANGTCCCHITEGCYWSDSIGFCKPGWQNSNKSQCDKDTAPTVKPTEAKSQEQKNCEAKGCFWERGGVSGCSCGAATPTKAVPTTSACGNKTAQQVVTAKSQCSKEGGRWDSSRCKCDYSNGASPTVQQGECSSAYDCVQDRGGTTKDWKCIGGLCQRADGVPTSPADPLPTLADCDIQCNWATEYRQVVNNQCSCVPKDRDDMGDCPDSTIAMRNSCNVPGWAWSAKDCECKPKEYITPIVTGGDGDGGTGGGDTRPGGCKECPSTYRCYKNSATGELKWFAPGYVQTGFVATGGGSPTMKYQPMATINPGGPLNTSGSNYSSSPGGVLGENDIAQFQSTPGGAGGAVYVTPSSGSWTGAAVTGALGGKPAKPTCIPRPACLDLPNPCKLTLPQNGSFCPPDTMELKDPCTVAGIPRPTFLGKAKGDADCDGRISTNDFSVWRSEYVKSGMGSTAGVYESDFDCNKKSDTNDFSIWRQNYWLFDIQIQGGN